MPPANYTGPIAEGPILKAGHYWVYENVHGRRVTKSSGPVPGQLRFPLWVGKWWSFESLGFIEGRAPRKVPPDIAMEIDCKVVSFKQITVIAGTFGAFQCHCICGVSLPGFDIDPYCGKWTYWFAPEVKNIIRLDDEDTENSFELVEYQIPDSGSR